MKKLRIGKLAGITAGLGSVAVGLGVAAGYAIKELVAEDETVQKVAIGSLAVVTGVIVTTCVLKKAAKTGFYKSLAATTTPEKTEAALDKVNEAIKASEAAAETLKQQTAKVIKATETKAPEATEGVKVETPEVTA